MKKIRIFYGWWIVVAVFFISAYASGIIFYGFTALLDPVTTEFGWGYAQTSVAASLRGLEAGLIVPVVGFLIDRFGPRNLIIAGAVLIGVGLFLFSRVSALWMFYGAFFIISLGMSTTSGVVPMTLIGTWFRKNVSTANGIATCGTAFGGLMVPVVTKLIEIYQWRMAMVILAVGVIVIVLPLSMLIRRKPEDIGLLPDGEKYEVQKKENNPASSGPVNKASDVLKESVRSRIFWQLSIAFTCHIIATAALITHIMPHLTSIGISTTNASLAAGGIALLGMLGRICFGWLGDRYDKRVIVAIGFIITIVGMLLLNFIAGAGTWMLIPAVIVFGFGFGGPIPLVATLVLDYFGRNKLGPILGLAMGVMMLGGMLGPPLAGWVFDVFRSYEYAWYGAAALIGIGTICILTTPSGKNLSVI